MKTTKYMITHHEKITGALIYFLDALNYLNAIENFKNSPNYNKFFNYMIYDCESRMSTDSEIYFSLIAVF